MRAGSRSTARNVSAAVARGLSVVQGDADTDLANYPDHAFDYAILSQTLQTARAPDRVLDELLRIGRRAFVSFPNFAYWRVRLALLWGGRMPVTQALPVSWYETENIHQLTIDDFRAFVARARHRRSRTPGSSAATGGRARRRRISAPNMRCSCCGGEARRRG